MQLSPIVRNRFLNPPQAVMINPPTIEPAKKVTSLAVSRQTSSP